MDRSARPLPRFQRPAPRLGACALAALLALAPLPALALGAGFFDPFERFDPERWYISDGWTNGAHQNCTWARSAIGIGDGTLRLRFLPDAGTDPKAPHLCGEIQTRQRFGPGTFEARIRSDRGSGFNAAFFTYIGPTHDAPHDEIDFEILTRDTGAVWTNRFVNGKDRGAGHSVPVSPATDVAFHDYAFIWEPDRLRWFVDGVLVREETRHIPTEPQKIFASLWASDTLTQWMGPFETPEAAREMVIDWIAYTPLGAGCAFEESLLCQLR